MARAAADWLQLHSVYFVPAARNPLKAETPRASSEHRLAMLHEALAGNLHFHVWEGELYREGPSYTLESVRHIERVYPNSRLFWIIGSDQLDGLQDWYGIDELVRKIGFILVQRPGAAFTWPGIPGLFIYPVPNPLNPVSATEIRARAGRGLAVNGLVPPGVKAHIVKHGLYR